MSDDLQDLKKKLQLKRREKEEEKPVVDDVSEDDAVAASPDDDFSLPFESNDEGPSEAAQAILAARAAFERGEIKPHKQGVSVKRIVVTVAIALVLVGAGLAFGKVFRMREIENRRIDEALTAKAYFDTKNVADGSKTVFRAVEDFKGEVERFLTELDEARKQGKTPEQMKDRIAAFLDVCLAFVQNQSYFPEGEVYPVDLVNSELLGLSLPVVSGVRELYVQAAALADLGEKIKTLEAPKSAVAFAVLVVPNKEIVKATSNPPVGPDGQPTGEPQVIDVEIARPKLTLVEAGNVEENPMWGTASDAEKRTMERWLVPYKTFGGGEIQAAKTSEIGQIDAAPILAKKDESFVNAAIGDAAQRIYGLRETIQRLNFKKLNQFFDKQAARDKYFTL